MLGRDWLGMKLPANGSDRLPLGGAHVGSRSTEAQGPSGSSLCSAQCQKQSLQGTRPLSFQRAGRLWVRGHLGSLDSKIPAPPSAREDRELCPHPHRAWEPVGWEVPPH